MRFLVGVMYSGENEYQQCLDAIAAQTHTDWELFKIEHLPNKEAHQKLYKTFESRAEEFDAFIKIDADTVLNKNSAFKDIESFLNREPQVEHAVIRLNDFYTQEQILGLNIYRSSVHFSETPKVKVDHVNENIKNSVLLGKEHALCPIADHSPNPTQFQAFHFGCHKSLKVVHLNDLRHFRNITKTAKTYKKTKDTRHRLALIGAAISLFNKIQPKDIGYNSQKLQSYFKKTIQKPNWIQELLYKWYCIKLNMYYILLKIKIKLSSLK